MITGTPWKSLLFFALPMIFGNILQQLYNIVDTIIVGKFVGQNALSAVGSATTVINVYISIAVGLGTGCLIVFSQLYGAGKFGRLKTAINTSLVSFAALSLIMTAIAFAVTDVIMNFMNTPDILMNDSKTYYLIYIIGMPALYMYNICNSVFNSLGKSSITLIMLGGSSVLNVGLDLWFVLGFGWGVTGAAVATVISMYAAAIVVFILMLGFLKKKINLNDAGGALAENKFFDFQILGTMAKVAIPTMICQVVVSSGYMVLQSLANTFGVDVVSGYVSVNRVDSICIVPMVQVSNALATYTGQNVGANQYDRVYKGLKAALVMIAVISFFFCGIMHLFSEGIVGLFMEEGVNHAAIQSGRDYIMIMGTFYFLMGCQSVFSGLLRGAGDVLKSTIGVLANFVGRCIFAYVIAALTGSEFSIYWCNPIGWAIGLSIYLIFFFQGSWKNKRLADKI